MITASSDDDEDATEALHRLVNNCYVWSLFNCSAFFAAVSRHFSYTDDPSVLHRLRRVNKKWRWSYINRTELHISIKTAMMSAARNDMSRRTTVWSWEKSGCFCFPSFLTFLSVARFLFFYFMWTLTFHRERELHGIGIHRVPESMSEIYFSWMH